MKIIFASYAYLPEFTSPANWLSSINFYTVIIEALAKCNTVAYVGQIGCRGNYGVNGVQYYFPCLYKKKPLIALRFNAFIKEQNPDIVIVPGFHFPLQVLLLRAMVGKKVKIILEHQADRPGGYTLKMLQKVAGRLVDAYHFTSLGNAREWLDAGIIKDESKCFEIHSTSSYFNRQVKATARQQLNMGPGTHFLWVGRLDENKDPLNVLNGFEQYLLVRPGAKLHMIFQAEALLPWVEKRIAESVPLREAVLLHGKIPHASLAEWYSAADFFISGSHSEGGSVALVEAMSCGCIPIVTTIPAAMKVISNGEFGLAYPPGDAQALQAQLIHSGEISKEAFSAKVVSHFAETLSPEAIAKQLDKQFRQLLSNQVQ